MSLFEIFQIHRNWWEFLNNLIIDCTIDFLETILFINDVVSNSLSFTSDWKLKIFLYSRIIVLKISDMGYQRYISSILRRKVKLTFNVKGFPIGHTDFRVIRYYRKEEGWVTDRTMCQYSMYPWYTAGIFTRNSKAVCNLQHELYFCLSFSPFYPIGNRGI